MQSIGKVGRTANGVVLVTSRWADATGYPLGDIPLGVKPSWPASRLPQGKEDPRFRTKPELAWELVEEAWSGGIPSVLRVPSGCHSTHGVWQVVADEAHPPAFTPKEATERVSPEQWQQVVRQDSHGKDLMTPASGYPEAELELGNASGPRQALRLIAATTNPATLKKDATWYLITNLPLHEASAQEVNQTSCLRDWVETYLPPPPELAALLAHVAHSRPLEAST